MNGLCKLFVCVDGLNIRENYILLGKDVLQGYWYWRASVNGEVPFPLVLQQWAKN